MGEFPLNGALQPVRGEWYLLLSKAMLKLGGWKLGDEVRVRFRGAEQDVVEVPECKMRWMRMRPQQGAGKG